MDRLAAQTRRESEAAEQRAARHFVKHHEAEKLSSTEHRVEDVQRRLEQLETDQRNMLEQLTGRFDVMTKRMVGGGRPKPLACESSEAWAKMATEDDADDDFLFLLVFFATFYLILVVFNVIQSHLSKT